MVIKVDQVVLVEVLVDQPVVHFQEDLVTHLVHHLVKEIMVVLEFIVDQISELAEEEELVQ
jgi:hypothetical protein